MFRRQKPRLFTRSIVLFEILIALALLSAMMGVWCGLEILKARQLAQQLQRLALRSAIDRCWYYALRPQKLRDLGLRWETFETLESNVYPFPNAEIPVGTGTALLRGHVDCRRVRQVPLRSPKAWKRLIRADLHLYLGNQHLMSTKWFILHRTPLGSG